MSITITDADMICTYSPHWVWPEADSWVVSWLAQPVEYTAAITALNLAELHAGSLDEHMSPQQRRRLAKAFAAELGMSSEDAAARIHASGGTDPMHPTLRPLVGAVRTRAWRRSTSRRQVTTPRRGGADRPDGKTPGHTSFWSSQRTFLCSSLQV